MKQYCEEGKVFILQIESNLKCPVLCNYCYAVSLPDSLEGLTSEQIKSLLDSDDFKKITGHLPEHAEIFLRRKLS